MAATSCWPLRNQGTYCLLLQHVHCVPTAFLRPLCRQEGEAGHGIEHLPVCSWWSLGGSLAGLPSLPPSPEVLTRWPSHVSALSSPVPWLCGQTLAQACTTSLTLTQPICCLLGGWEGVHLSCWRQLCGSFTAVCSRASALTSEPHFAHLSNGYDHFKHHSCSKTMG